MKMSNEKRTILICTCLLLSGMLSCSGCSMGGVRAVVSEDTAKVVPVHVMSAETRVFEDRIIAQGNLASKKSALVAPRIDGTITDIFVDEGDVVKANETRLFQIDKVKVERAAAIAEQDLAMAQAGLHDAEAQLASIQAQYDKAKLDFNRFTRLFEQKAITPDAMEKADAGFKVASAGLERAKAGLAVAAERVKQAESAMAISQKTLADSLILAPIDGIVSMRMKEPGEFGAAGTPLMRLIDPTLLELSAFLPGEYYPKVNAGQTEVRITANGVDAGTGKISFKSPEIQPTLRTFEIKCLVENPPEGIVPGSLANLSAVLSTKEAVGVPTNAIQHRGEKDIVFTVAGDLAKTVEITRGVETDGWTEVTNNSIEAGASIITMGQSLVNDGVKVAVREETSDVAI
jgi:multidrug efflux pump subunit AcrA (membrane-fusion protein)